MTLQIRSSVYQGRDGFLICGKDNLGRNVSIFAETREEAELVKINKKAGRDPFAHRSER